MGCRKMVNDLVNDIKKNNKVVIMKSNKKTQHYNQLLNDNDIEH